MTSVLANDTGTRAQLRALLLAHTEPIDMVPAAAPLLETLRPSRVTVRVLAPCQRGADTRAIYPSPGVNKDRLLFGMALHGAQEGGQLIDMILTSPGRLAGPGAPVDPLTVGPARV